MTLLLLLVQQLQYAGKWFSPMNGYGWPLCMANLAVGVLTSRWPRVSSSIMPEHDSDIKQPAGNYYFAKHDNSLLQLNAI